MTADEIEELLSNLNPSAASEAGEAHAQAAQKLADIANSLATHASKLADAWTGNSADSAVATFQALHTQASSLATTANQIGAAMSFFGKAVSGYQNYTAPTTGTTSSDPVTAAAAKTAANQAAQEVFNQVQQLHVEANSHLPATVSFNPPKVNTGGSPSLSGSVGGGAGFSSPGSSSPGGSAGVNSGGGSGPGGSTSAPTLPKTGTVTPGTGTVTNVTTTPPPKLSSVTGPGSPTAPPGTNPVSPTSPVSPTGPVSPVAPVAPAPPGNQGPGQSNGPGSNDSDPTESGLPPDDGLVPTTSPVPGDDPGVLPGVIGDGPGPGDGIVPGDLPTDGVTPFSGFPGSTTPGNTGSVTPRSFSGPGDDLGEDLPGGLEPIGPDGMISTIPGEPGGVLGVSPDGGFPAGGAADEPFSAGGFPGGGAADGGFADSAFPGSGFSGSGVGGMADEDGFSAGGLTDGGFISGNPAAGGADGADGYPMGGGTGQKRDEKDRYRDAWMNEDAELWDGGAHAVPSVIDR